MRRVPHTGIIGAVALREAAATDFAQVMALVRAALDLKLKGASDNLPWYDIEAMYADRVIIERDGRCWQYPYTIGADNVVTIADPIEVVEDFKPVGMKESIDADSAFIESSDEGKVWDVIVIRSGTSLNGVFYSDSVLREAAAKFEGARVFAKSNDVHIKGERPDINKVAGWLSDVKFVEGKTADTGCLQGRLNMVGKADLREAMVDAWKRGKKDLVGLSIDAVGAAKRAAAGFREGVKKIAQSITKVLSVDLIVDPSAGGGLVRLVESANPEEQSEMALKDIMKARIRARFPAVDVESLDDTALEARYAEAIQAEAKPAPPADDVRELVRMIECRANARIAIAAAKLPDAAKEKLNAEFAARTSFVEADVAAAIKNEREYLSRFTESGHVQLGELAEISVEDRSKKVSDMFDAFFDPAHKDHRSAQSFKECYIEVTGDRRVTGRLEHCDRTRMAESLGAAFRESLDSTSFSSVLGNSITRRMIAEYRGAVDYASWRQICNVVPVSDFRTQDRVRFGGYGDLPTVSERDAYTGLASPTDEKAQYSAAKRGGTEDITLEMIKNDDVGTVRRIPVKMGRSAARTVSKFVFDFIRLNANVYDGVAFFHASHGNLGSTALSAAEFAVARLAMLKQAELSSADRLGIGPKGILVPLDLQETAWNIFQRNTNLDKTFIQSMVPTIIPVWYWTDTNDWAIYADPLDIPGIEVGFLDGQEEPEVFVQDMPNVGSMFSNDSITYKIRHIYGGAVTDYRAFYKEVV